MVPLHPQLLNKVKVFFKRLKEFLFQTHFLVQVPFAKLICHRKSKYVAGYILSIIFGLQYFHIDFKDDTRARGVMGLGYKFVWFY